MVNLGFDFSDDQGDYETYDEEKSPTVTEKTNGFNEQQQYILDGSGDLTPTHQQDIQEATKTLHLDGIDSKQDTELATATTLMDHDSLQQEQQDTWNESLDDEVFTNEPDVLIESVGH
ncbi:unnamed protein product [Absidia cylindrospora]